MTTEHMEKELYHRSIIVDIIPTGEQMLGLRLFGICQSIFALNSVAVLAYTVAWARPFTQLKHKKLSEILKQGQHGAVPHGTEDLVLTSH